jgi:class 3 adenylate cyclase
MYNHLGQLALRRGYREAAAGRKAAARKQWSTAAGWLNVAITRSREKRWLIREAFALKDRALVYLAEDNLDEAEAAVAKAEELFRSKSFTEGIAHVNRVWGAVHRARERYDESTRALRQALAYFDDVRERAETARTQLEIARTVRAADHPKPLVTQEFLIALEGAEACRRVRLVREIEEELEAVDPEALLRHVYRRARGRRVTEDTTSLLSGTSEVATVLCIDVEGAAACSREGDPEVVLLTLNQVLADLEVVLDRHKGQVTSYVGGGFMALFREARHAERAVSAALDLMAALDEFNRPRSILNLVQFQGRIGIATGGVFLGNVGTYHKMDYTALGPPVRLAFHLQDEAEPGSPCLSEETYQMVATRFRFQGGNPRIVKVKGGCDLEVWDVVGKK